MKYLLLWASISIVGGYFVPGAPLKVIVLPGNDLGSAALPILAATPQPDGDCNILSKDYAVAEIALSNAILTKNKATMKLGLGSRFLSFRQKIADSIGETGDEDFVPNLVEALQQNQSIVGGGSEIQIEQADLNKTYIKVLSNLTKIRFKTSEDPTTTEIADVISKSDAWWRTHQAKKDED